MSESDNSPLATNRIIEGDSFDVLADLPENAVHAVVTDPPYGLNFMPDVTNGWDDFEPEEYQQWCRDWSSEAMRVLKPGGHLLAFSGSRTHHRLFAGVEDAGYELRDCITWHYGGGFPKSLDVSKAIDKQADAEREVVGENPNADKQTGQSGTVAHGDREPATHITAPATDEAEQWEGFKTALKPSTEFVTLARKPFDGTVAENVLEHGTAALNIGATRIHTDGEKINRNIYDGEEYDGSNYGQVSRKVTKKYTDKGRYPANLVLDEQAAQQLDEQTGELSSGVVKKSHNVQSSTAKNCYGEYGERTAEDINTIGDSGGASRFFYTAKASRSERTLNGRIDNAHPTVKPVDLMEWLVKLATAEGQIVLDPFAGTGTTCLASKNTGREFVGIEQQAKWADVARVRCGLTPDDPSVVRSGENMGLEVFADGE